MNFKYVHSVVILFIIGLPLYSQEKTGSNALAESAGNADDYKLHQKYLKLLKEISYKNYEQENLAFNRITPYGLNREELNNQIRLGNKFKSKVESLLNKSIEADKLARKFGFSADSYNNLKSRIKIINNSINLLQNELDQQNSTDKKVNNTYNKASIIKGKRDVLAQQNKADDDFFANYESNKTEKSIDDFLNSTHSTEQSSHSDDDFFSSENTDKDFFSDETSKVEIKWKDGYYGVIDKNGRTLIPFEFSEIYKYKSGIAHVAIEIDSYYKKCYVGLHFSGKAYKVGFTNSSGKFLDGYKIKITGGAEESVYLKLTSTNDNRTSEEIRADKRYWEEKKQLLYQECKSKFNDWKRSVLSQHE